MKIRKYNLWVGAPFSEGIAVEVKLGILKDLSDFFGLGRENSSQVCYADFKEKQKGL